MTHPPSGLQLTAPRFSMTGRMVAMSPGEDGLIGIPFPEHSSELLSRLNAQRRSGLLCDLTLTSRGARYPTHRSVMAAVSLYFRRLFGAEEGGEGGEGGEGVGGSCSVCQLDCVSPDALDALLEFAYTATLTIRSSGMRDVLEGAQLLGIQCVADACRHILGETAEEPASVAEDARRATSRRKQDRRSVAKTTSPVRPAWRDPEPEVLKQHTQEYDLPPTPEREELPLPGQNGAMRSSHRGAVLNGGAHWPLVRTPVPQPLADLPSEEEEARGEGSAMSHSAASQAGLALARAAEGSVSVRKRKSQTPQQCPVCQKIIHGAGKLPRHMRTHTGEKPFQCTACGVRFTRNDKLKIHMRKHTGERPYPCPSCPARFLHSYDLKNHLSLHSGDRPYECPLCHKAFAREDHLQRHRKGHSCLELRTRRPRRGPELHASPPADPPLRLHQPSAPPSSSAAQFPFQQGPDSSGAGVSRAAPLGPGGVNYPSLLWRAAESRRGVGHTTLTQARWEEEEEDEENGEDEES